MTETIFSLHCTPFTRRQLAHRLFRKSPVRDSKLERHFKYMRQIKRYHYSKIRLQAIETVMSGKPCFSLHFVALVSGKHLQKFSFLLTIRQQKRGPTEDPSEIRP